MSDMDDLRQKLASFNAETEPEAFWELLTTEAVTRVNAAFTFVLLVAEDDEFIVYPGPGLEDEEMDDLDESPTFGAAIEAVGRGGSVRTGEPSAQAEVVFSLAVPLKVGGEVAGAVAAERYEPSAFSDEDVAALEALVAVFGPSLENFFE